MAPEELKELAKAQVIRFEYGQHQTVMDALSALDNVRAAFVVALMCEDLNERTRAAFMSRLEVEVENAG